MRYRWKAAVESFERVETKTGAENVHRVYERQRTIEVNDGIEVMHSAIQEVQGLGNIIHFEMEKVEAV